jgi:hypothetical protein
MIFTNETFTTDIASIRFFSSMEAHVSAQVRLVVELLGADLTFIGLLPRMLAQVLLVQVVRGEPLAARVTFKGLVSRMKTFIMLG